MPKPIRFRILTVATVLLAIVLGQVAFAAEADYVEGEVLVVFKPGCETGAAKAALGRRALKLDRHYRRISERSGRVAGLVKSKGLGTAALIARLKEDPEVESVEPNYLRYFSSTAPNDTEFSKLWGLQNTGQTANVTPGTSGVDINFLSARKMTRPSTTEVVVGVMDSGVDYSHPDLAANIWTNPGEIPGDSIDNDANGYVDDVRGYDFVAGSANVTDSGTHGTHVAGTIGAVAKNSAGIIGVEARTKILPLKISADGDTISASAFIEALNYAVGLKLSGVNIVALNASFGGPSFVNSEWIAINTLRGLGVVLCAAAGNEAVNNNITPSYPANYSVSNVISVAALTQNNNLASFSNYGATTVDIAAPGHDIYSTLPRDYISSQSSVSVATANYETQEIRYSGATALPGISGTIHDCGIGNPGDFPAGVSGNIALIERGTLTFLLKVTNAMNAGAVAAIIYDNTADPLSSGWTLGDSGLWIPAVQVTQASGLAILSALPASGTVVNQRDDSLAYQFLSGTSMACPHVAGAVAFAAINYPAESMSARISRIGNSVTLVPSLAGKMTTGGRLDLLKMVDTDEDSLPDWWETENFGSLPAEDASGDGDADGFTHLDEFLAATDPKDAASYLSFSALAALEDGMQTHFELSFSSVEDRCYHIEWSDTLEPGSWQTLGTSIIGTGEVLQVQDNDAIQAAARRFYRMSVLKD